MTSTSRPHRPPAPPHEPATQPSRGTQDEPRLPHERDESADSAPPEANPDQRKMGEQALKDVRQGRVDTDRGPVMDRLYRRNLRRSGAKDRRPR